MQQFLQGDTSIEDGSEFRRPKSILWYAGNNLLSNKSPSLFTLLSLHFFKIPGLLYFFNDSFVMPCESPKSLYWLQLPRYSLGFRQASSAVEEKLCV